MNGGAPLLAGKKRGGYEDEPGFCASADLAEIQGHGFVLTPGRYVGFEEEEDDGGEPFEVKMERLTAQLERQFAESERLQRLINQSINKVWQ
jgi:type I restriction enzyme M protein